MRVIAGSARSLRLKTLDGMDTRPTTDRIKETLFNMIGPSMFDCVFLDLFAGSGALALEALSRGAAEAVLADCDARAVRVERQNVEALGFSQRARVLQADWRETVRKLSAEGRSFQLVFLDPPYAMEDLTAVFEALRTGGLIDADSLVIVEHQAGHPPQVGEGFLMVDQRKYGYAGIHMFRMKGEA